MSRRVVTLPSASGVGAGQTATLRVPLGPTYHQLMVKATNDGSAVAAGSWSSVISEIRVNINGANKMRAPAGVFATLAQFYGITLADGVLPIFFARPWMRTGLEEDYLAYGTADVQSFGIELDFDAAAVAPTLEVQALVGPAAPLGQHVTLRRYNVGVAQTGEREVSELRRGNYGTMAFHYAAPGTALADFEVEANGAKLLDTDRATWHNYLRQTGRVPNSGWTHIDFCATNRLTDAVSMNVQDFRLRFDMLATGNLPLYQEAVEGQRPAAGG